MEENHGKYEEEAEIAFDDFDETEGLDEEFAPKPRSLLVRLIALLTVLSFIAMVFAFSLPDLELPPAEIILRSLQLQKDIDIQRLQEAVVSIEVIPKPSASMGGHKTGTGFNIRPEGLIITNHHVISDARNIMVTFPNDKTYSASNWESLEDFDLAVIRLEPGTGHLPVVPTATPGAALQKGDHVRIVGNPLGLENVVVEGEMDGYVRMGDNRGLVFSIDAPVYPGNSGSPVFDRSSEVVGVVFARYEKTYEDKKEIFGLAVSIDEIDAMSRK